MKTVNRFCRDCYQTTTHKVKYIDGWTYECIPCIKSGSSIRIEEVKKEEATNPHNRKQVEKILEVI